MPPAADNASPAPALPCTTEERSAGVGLPGVFLMIDSLQTGGSERQFVALSRSLDPAQFQVHLGCIQGKGAFLDGLSPKTFPLGGSLYGLHSWKTRINLSRHLRECGIAVAHAFDFYANLTLVPAARMGRIPVVIGSQRQLGDLLTPMQSRAQRMMFHWCDAVVCNSNAAAQRLIKEGLPERKTRVIWNGLGAETFAATAPALLPRAGWRRVGMIARMNTKAKDHSLFLRAAAQLQATHRQVEFVLIGDGPLRPELEREAASLGLSDRVRFLGDRRDIPALLASFDLTALPSKSESVSNSVIESMAAGVTVVATNVGDNPELLNEERGRLTAVGDVPGLSNAIGHLLNDDGLRVQMGHRCRTFARENLTIEKMSQSHARLYAELLGRKGWSGASVG